MLTDAAIKALRPRDKLYKVVDRDGMYIVVQPSGMIVFRLYYRLNGRRETVTLGRYGPAGLSLARAREKLIDARRAISEGRSPAQEKQREKRRLQEAKSFGEFGERWLQEARMADSNRAMRRSIFERDILPLFRKRLLHESLPEDLRALCAKVKERGTAQAPILAFDVVDDRAAGPRQQGRHDETYALARSGWRKAQDMLRAVVPEIVTLVAAEDHAVGAEQSGSPDLAGLGPARRAIGDDVLGLPRADLGQLVEYERAARDFGEGGQ